MIDATAESSFAPWRKASYPRPPRRPKGGTAGFFEEPAGGSGYAADCTTSKAWRVGISRQAPRGVPIVLGVIPDPSGQRTKWSGDQINVNLDLNGAKLDAAASTLTVDGKPITLSTPASLVYLAPAN